MSTTIAQIMARLDAIVYTYGGDTATNDSVFQLHEEDFEKFKDFPLVKIVMGTEDMEEQANKRGTVSLFPELHFFDEDLSVADSAGWQDAIRNAVMNDAVLRPLTLFIIVDSVVPSQPEDRKLNHIAFALTIMFDATFT